MLIISKDKLFSRMLRLALEDSGIDADVSEQLQPDLFGCIIDLDSYFPISGTDFITFSKNREKNPDLLRPFIINDLIRLYKARYSCTNDTDISQLSSDYKLCDTGIIYKGNEITLTDKELGLFTALYRRKGTPVSRNELIEQVWEGNVRGNVVDVYINYLRHKLDFCFGSRLIVTVRGKGYMLI